MKTFAENDLEVLVDKLSMSQEYALQAKMVNSTLSCIRQSILHKLREEVILTLFLALVKLVTSQYKRHMSIMEQAVSNGHKDQEMEHTT